MINEYKQFGISENSDSTSKKLIFQAPFHHVKEMTALIEQLEQTILEHAYVDVEINSLEDAYINIAREEEKLLADLQKRGVQRLS